MPIRSHSTPSQRKSSNTQPPPAPRHGTCHVPSSHPYFFRSLRACLQLDIPLTPLQLDEWIADVEMGVQFNSFQIHDLQYEIEKLRTEFARFQREAVGRGMGLVVKRLDGRIETLWRNTLVEIQKLDETDPDNAFHDHDPQAQARDPLERTTATSGEDPLAQARTPLAIKKLKKCELSIAQLELDRSAVEHYRAFKKVRSLRGELRDAEKDVERTKREWEEARWNLRMVEQEVWDMAKR